MQSTRPTTWCAVVLLVSQPALADLQSPEMGGFTIEVIGGDVSAHNPQVTVRVSAYFPSNYFAFGWADFGLESTDPDGTFASIILPEPIGPPGICNTFLPGSPSNGGIINAFTFQLNAVGCTAYWMNPIPIWEATWSTTDFTARDVQLTTANTTYFAVYETVGSAGGPDLIPLGLFQHGSAVIHVVPAPGLSLCAIGGIVCASRRRR
ncbi:MAG: hypothetical protein H6815_11385 [Phycisphaeraceae bacterium]|nr:hypothetical protein [Phycisphaerales bacterium]MCB9861040.1 hypothetical protein [Phycisphaeraceae bacterium]